MKRIHAIGFLLSVGCSADPTNEHSSSAALANVEDYAHRVSARQRPRVEEIEAHLRQTQSAAMVACTDVSVPSGQSLSNAVNAAIQAGGTGAYCLSPGTIDVPIRLPPSVALILRPGVFRQRAPIVFEAGAAQTGSGVIGLSAASTTLIFEAGYHGANISIGAFVFGYQVSGLTLTREAQGSQLGDSGITTDVSNDAGTLQNLSITNQFDGAYLRNTGLSWLKDSVISGSARHGIVFTSLGLGRGVASQWFLQNTLLAFNGGWGLYASPDDGHVCLENWDGLLTYGNYAGGVRLGSVDPSLAKVVDGLRVINSIFSNDGVGGEGAELQIDGGSLHQITNSYFENAGVSGDGNSRTEGVPGILIAAAVPTALFDNINVANNSGPGVSTGGQHIIVNGSTISNNTSSGISVWGGKVQATSDLFGNSGGQTSGVVSTIPDQIVSGSASNGIGDLYLGPPLDPLSSAPTASQQELGMHVMGSVAAPPVEATQPYSSTCRRVTFRAGESLGSAILAAIANGPGFYCVTAGTIDTEIHLPSDVILVLSPGTYNQTRSIHLDGSRSGVIGTGSSTSLKFIGDARGANLHVANGVEGFVVRDLMLTREVAGKAPGDSAVVAGVNQRGLFENLVVTNQFDGFYLMSTPQGWIRNTMVFSSKRHGLLMTNANSSGPAGYTIDKLFVSFSDGFGIYLSPDGGDMQMGTWTGVLSFDNALGMIYAGKSARGATQSLRIQNSFFGNDGFRTSPGAVSILGGTDHVLYQVYMELAGYDLSANATGVPALFLDRSVGSVSLRASQIGDSTGLGIVSYAEQLTLSSSMVTNNNRAPNPGAPAAGAYVGAGIASFVADYFDNSVRQPIGVYSEAPSVYFYASAAPMNSQPYAGSPLIMAEVRQLYLDLLGREPDAAGGLNSTSFVANGSGSLADLRRMISASEEMVAVITRYYDQILPGCLNSERLTTWQNWFAQPTATIAGFKAALENYLASNPNILAVCAAGG